MSKLELMTFPGLNASNRSVEFKSRLIDLRTSFAISGLFVANLENNIFVLGVSSPLISIDSRALAELMVKIKPTRKSVNLGIRSAQFSEIAHN